MGVSPLFQPHAACAHQLGKHGLSRPALNKSEVALFDAVLGHELVDEAMLSHVAAAAASADAQDDVPNRSLARLAGCAATCVSRRLALGRLFKAARQLKGDKDETDCEYAFARTPKRRRLLDSRTVNDRARAHVLISLLMPLPEAEIERRIESILRQSGAAGVRILLTGLSSMSIREDVDEGGQRASLVAARCLASLDTTRSAEIVWSQDGELLMPLMNHSCELFLRYMAFLVDAAVRHLQSIFEHERSCEAAAEAFGARDPRDWFSAPSENEMPVLGVGAKRNEVRHPRGTQKPLLGLDDVGTRVVQLTTAEG